MSYAKLFMIELSHIVFMRQSSPSHEATTCPAFNSTLGDFPYYGFP
jgi:hypothetical protein